MQKTPTLVTATVFPLDEKHVGKMLCRVSLTFVKVETQMHSTFIGRKNMKCMLFSIYK